MAGRFPGQTLCHSGDVSHFSTTIIYYYLTKNKTCYFLQQMYRNSTSKYLLLQKLNLTYSQIKMLFLIHHTISQNNSVEQITSLLSVHLVDAAILGLWVVWWLTQHPTGNKKQNWALSPHFLLYVLCDTPTTTAAAALPAIPQCEETFFKKASALSGIGSYFCSTLPLAPHTQARFIALIGLLPNFSWMICNEIT